MTFFAAGDGVSFFFRIFAAVITLNGMMKRNTLIIIATTFLLLLSGNNASAVVGDAMKGIWPVTDPSVMKSLNGRWQLKVIPGIGTDSIVPPADSTWGVIPVPGCWEPYGFSQPKYNYPDSITGYYRMDFTVPSEWRGQRVIIRFDGVLRGYNLWINNQYAGSWQSGYNTCLFDITSYLTRRAF